MRDPSASGQAPRAPRQMLCAPPPPSPSVLLLLLLLLLASELSTALSTEKAPLPLPEGGTELATEVVPSAWKRVQEWGAGCW